MQYLVSAAEMQELDRRAIEMHRLPGRVLMEVAGRAVAEALVARVAAPARIVVVAGTGNNGGDGFVAARALLALGYDVRVFIVGERDKLKADARSALAPLEVMASDRLIAVKDARGIWELSEYLGRAAWAVDALLGTGATGDVRGQVAEAIAALNEATCPKLAVDMPSGIDADTGAVLGRAVRADATVTFAFPKRGHLLYPGAEHTGALTVVDIGIASQLAEGLPVMGRVVTAADGPADCRVRPANAHKGDFGHVVVFAGSEAFPGAAVLALAGALRSGAGLVSWATDAGTVLRAPPRPPEVMLREQSAVEQLSDFVGRALNGASAVVAGPGLGITDRSRSVLLALFDEGVKPLCLDADALNLLARDGDLWAHLTAPAVVTPHPKEMARLLGTTVEVVQRDRVAAALELAASRRIVVVLKGAHSIVAEPDGSFVLVNAGNPGMATGGTGDVLAGMIGAFLAQGFEPARAARVGALLHAVAGDVAAKRHGITGLLASDLVAALSEVWVSWQR